MRLSYVVGSVRWCLTKCGLGQDACLAWLSNWRLVHFGWLHHSFFEILAALSSRSHLLRKHFAVVKFGVLNLARTHWRPYIPILFFCRSYASIVSNDKCVFWKSCRSDNRTFFWNSFELLLGFQDSTLLRHWADLRELFSWARPHLRNPHGFGMRCVHCVHLGWKLTVTTVHLSGHKIMILCFGIVLISLASCLLVSICLNDRVSFNQLWILVEMRLLALDQ